MPFHMRKTKLKCENSQNSGLHDSDVYIILFCIFEMTKSKILDEKYAMKAKHKKAMEEMEKLQKELKEVQEKLKQQESKEQEMQKGQRPVESREKAIGTRNF